MQRTKVFGIAAALVTAGLAAVLFAGGASAASWHTYEGDVFAGHAYALEVPEGAENVELVFDGAPTGSASVALYAPGGVKTGHYKLTPELAKASIANPAKGTHVLYVYDVTEGALSLRVASEAAPRKLDLAAVELTREDMKIGAFEKGALQQTITATLDAETVFVTLLYEGSSRDLDATVRSSKGAVVTITDETATAFEPGVWTSLKGERVFDAANLDGTAYTVELRAAEFEGTMVLTTLRLETEKPTFLPRTPLSPSHEHPSHEHSAHPPHAKHARPAPGLPTGSAQFALVEGMPLAFTVTTATTLVLEDPAAMDEDGDGDESYGDGCVPVHGRIVIYAPDDSVVGVFELSHNEPSASLALEVPGEYVAYARHVEGEPIRALLEGQKDVSVRALEIEEQVFSFGGSALLVSEATMTFEVEHVPIDMVVRMTDGAGALPSVEVSNEAGVVAYASALAAVPGTDLFEWSRADPENFAAGLHEVEIHGVYDGAIEIVYVRYVRGSEAEVDAHAEKVHAHGPTHEPTPPAPPAPPEPPAPGIPSVRALVPKLPL